MTNSQAAAEYRVMVGFAVVHSLALLGLGASVPWWLQRLWVGCVTLWFLWVIVLLLHPGRSTRRLAVSLPLLLILMLPVFEPVQFRRAGCLRLARRTFDESSGGLQMDAVVSRRE